MHFTLTQTTISLMLCSSYKINSSQFLIYTLAIYNLVCQSPSLNFCRETNPFLLISVFLFFSFQLYNLTVLESREYLSSSSVISFSGRGGDLPEETELIGSVVDFLHQRIWLSKRQGKIIFHTPTALVTVNYEENYNGRIQSRYSIPCNNVKQFV